MHVYSDPIQNFISFLIADMQAAAANPTAFAQTLLDGAKAKIAAGQGEIAFLTGTSLNGKTFNREKDLSAMEVAFCCRRAIDEYTDLQGDASQVTFPNFGHM